MRSLIVASFLWFVFTASAFTNHVNSQIKFRISNASSKYARAHENWSLNYASLSVHDRDNIGIHELVTMHRDADVIFSIINVSGSGLISRRELTKHLKAVGYTYAVVNSIFDKLDIDRDGKISRKEFREGFVLFSSLRSAKGMGNDDSEFKEQIHQDADDFFQSVDIDGDGEIDLIELKAHLRDTFSQKAIVDIFKMLDINGDRRISREELRDAFVRYSALRLRIKNL